MDFYFENIISKMNLLVLLRKYNNNRVSKNNAIVHNIATVNMFKCGNNNIIINIVLYSDIHIVLPIMKVEVINVVFDSI